MRKLSNIEFYNTPSGEVMSQTLGESPRVLKVDDREFIDEMLSIIRDRYSKAYNQLLKIYSAGALNKYYNRYKIVHHFIRCNFGEYDQLSYDINSFGLFVFEEVKCPMRGHCPHQGIICRPEVDTHLSDREMDVYRRLAMHIDIEDIADELSISKFTVIRHRENIKARLNLKSMPELITYWHVNQLK